MVDGGSAISRIYISICESNLERATFISMVPVKAIKSRLVQMIWTFWFNTMCDKPAHLKDLVEQKPYKILSCVLPF